MNYAWTLSLLNLKGSESLTNMHKISTVQSVHQYCIVLYGSQSVDDILAH